MIGIILSIVSWGYAAADGIKRAIYTNDGYKRGLQRREEGTDDTNSYFDWQGNRRDLDTGHPISVDFKVVESNGRDRLIKDLKTGKVIRNLTEEKRQEKYHKRGKYHLHEATFYMDMNGYLIRESDTDKMKRKNGDPHVISEKEAKDFIELFNSKQATCGWNETKHPSKDYFGNPVMETKFQKAERKQEYYCNRNAIYSDV